MTEGIKGNGDSQSEFPEFILARGLKPTALTALVNSKGTSKAR